MSETNATILIPDISGFTEFMTTTELSHSTKAINMLIDAIIKSAEDEYEVSEIEGDAVLLIRKEEAPSQKEIIDACLKIFTAFHAQRLWIQHHAICPCGACQAIGNLALKFVVHYGAVAEIKTGRFVKQSGAEMIIAHRLLKNSIDSNEYLLISEQLLRQSADSAALVQLQWTHSSEQYPSIGKVDYRYALLNEARENILVPPQTQSNYEGEELINIQMHINANYKDVYMVLMNIPGRPTWQQGLLKVEQEMDGVFVGSIHHCSFENYTTIVSPLSMQLSDSTISYSEKCTIEEMDIILIHEFLCSQLTETASSFSCRIINTNSDAIPETLHDSLAAAAKQMTERLKDFCEQTNVSAFKPMMR
ncbi:MAG TPA: DUF2652 domain-containing protein [Chitinophagaceae bacterium]|nr:DUF2652 domain-containing protein [Chitinophagaceae bacterium]